MKKKKKTMKNLTKKIPINFNTLKKPIIFLTIFLFLSLILFKNYPDVWWTSNDDPTIPPQPIQSSQPTERLTPTGKFSSKNNLPSSKIQFDFPVESDDERKLRELRKESIKQGFLHAWNGYSKYAWGADEVEPITNTSRRHLNGWGATMVDSLDTMWIMDLKDEFKNATNHLSGVDFTYSNMNVNFFETVIRYLGGLLSAHELSGDEILFQKAKDLGRALYPAFSSPSGLPYNNWNLARGLEGNYRPFTRRGILAEVGTSQLEYMKLAQLTGNRSYFDVAQRVIDTLDKAKKDIPGLYPTYVDISTGEFSANDISIGNFGDSFYEYLLKQYVLVGGSNDQYKRMYEESAESIVKYLVKEGQVKDEPDLLFIGSYSYGRIYPKMDHLSCFVPGMLAIGSKILNRPKDLDVAIRIAETCYWSYKITATGIGPENFMFIPKDDSNADQRNQFPTLKSDTRYLLRPETVESLFVLYRVTGDKKYQERGWKIWESIESWCKTPTAYSGLQDVTSETPQQNNNMESFFLAETMKYLYLLFSTPDVISLDNYVFNTEAHPFLIQKKS